MKKDKCLFIIITLFTLSANSKFLESNTIFNSKVIAVSKRSVTVVYQGKNWTVPKNVVQKKKTKKLKIGDSVLVELTPQQIKKRVKITAPKPITLRKLKKRYSGHK